MKKRYFILLMVVSFFSKLPIKAQEISVENSLFLKYTKSNWVDSIMKTLTPDERAQLIMVAAYSNRGEEHKKEILGLIKENNIGGLIFFQGDPKIQARLMNDYQATSKAPILGVIDAESGLGMRLDNSISYPFQMTLGAEQDSDLIYQMGEEVAKQIKRSGLHLNFVPVGDVNNYPNNRFFGEDKYNVAAKSVAHMQEKQDEELLTTADALLAGNDLLESTKDVPKAIEEIRKAVKQGFISQKEIDRRVRKILTVKQWVGLNEYEPTEVKNIVKDLNTPENHLLNRKLVEASLTVLKNKQNLIPLQRLDTLRIASISFGSKETTPFQKILDLYTGVTHFVLPLKPNEIEINTLKGVLKQYNLVIAGIHDNGKFPRNNLRYSEAAQSFISELAQKENSIFAFFKNPYVLDKIEKIEDAEALVVAYQDTESSQELAGQLIFGGIGATGKLPVSVGEKFKIGDGIDVEGGMRFKYTFPEEVGMDSEILGHRIDSLMSQAINMKATPGGQILVAKDQKVIFHEAYGVHVYHDTIKVKKDDLYDLASVTKISASMAALMKLYDEEKFELDGTLADHLPKFKRSNKADIPFRDFLTHQARLPSGLPFWQNTLRKNGSYRWWTIKKDYSRRYPIKITDEMYLHRNYSNKMMEAIRKAPLLKKKEYRYSDLFFILAPRVVESRTDESFPVFLEKNFYDPLGATSLGFNPEYPDYKIVPTENDFIFRHQLVDGRVHDEGAALLGGVSGHAGLFANANDLAKLLQMYLNMGKYGGKRYLKEETVREFTRLHFPDSNNFRALGFDKRRPNNEGVVNNTAHDASPASFGHTGFTGIMVWMDPEIDLLYIFLSNRVHPTRDNHRLYSLDTRTKIQQVLYDSLKK